MCNSLRFGSALSAIAVASMIGGCAAPQKATGFGGRVADSNIGAATRAAFAIQANDFAAAIPLAEQAVASSPTDAGFRSLLGNAYFGGGRFASAEAAYRDSLSIYSNQPQIVLKLALVQIAQGKHDEAVAFLDAARDVLPSADYGLALALSGRSADAIAVLEPAARSVNADSQVRQNLALAYAFSGDWAAARTVAAQDLPADQLDARIQQWMTLAKPARVSDQVAALTGIKPAAVDPGQPTRLALHANPTRVAQAAPSAVSVPQTEPAPAEPQVAFNEAPQAAPFVQEAPAPAPVPVAPVATPAPAPAPAPVTVAAAPAVDSAPDFVAASAPEAVYAAPAPAPRVVKAAAPRKAPPVRNASLTRSSGRSTAVVQIGAYGSRERVAVAWNLITKRYPALRAYAPMTARFNSPKGVVYRLSIKGFANQQEAINRCGLLKSRGGSCFVRSIAGDVPVQMASR